MGRPFAVLAALVVALAWPGAAAALSKTSLRIPMDDGVELAATLYRQERGPPPAGPGLPGIVMLHGLGGTRASMNTLAEASFVLEGYVVLTYDARGHGESGGLFSGNGPREIADLRALHAWLAARPGIDGTRIGAWGISYGGGAVLRALVEGVPFAAAEVVETWSDLYPALFPQELAKSRVVSSFFDSVAALRTAPEVTVLRADALASRNLPALRAFASARSSLSGLSSVRVPVLVFQGRRDFTFDLEQGLGAYRALAGPKRLYVGNFGHAPSIFPGPDILRVRKLALDWFARFLRGVPNGVDTRAPVELAASPSFGLPGAAYGGLPATRRVSFAARGGGGRITATGSLTRTFGRTQTLLETFGAPVVRLTASGTFPHVVAVLSARTPLGARIVVAEGGAAVRLSAQPRTITLRLGSQVTAIARGSRLTLRIGPASGGLYTAPVPVGASLTVSATGVTLPVLRRPVSR